MCVSVFHVFVSEPNYVIKMVSCVCVMATFLGKLCHLREVNLNMNYSTFL